MQKHINKKKKTDTRTGKTAAKKKNSRSKRRKSSRVRQRNQRILMSLMLLVIIVLIGWIIINRASENGWSIGDFLHNSDTMISDAEQSGTDNADSCNIIDILDHILNIQIMSIFPQLLTSSFCIASL